MVVQSTQMVTGVLQIIELAKGISYAQDVLSRVKSCLQYSCEVNGGLTVFKAELCGGGTIGQCKNVHKLALLHTDHATDGLSYNYIIIQEMEQKAKLLKKYMGEAKITKQRMMGDGLRIRDNQVEINDSLSSDQESGSDGKGRARIRSDSEGEIEQKQVVDAEYKKSKRVTKGIRKALGLRKGEDADQFLQAVKIEGVEMKELESYLKHNKQGLHMQKKSKKQRKAAKQQQKQGVKEQHQQERESSSSDLVIPQQARTIYRNKDGTIREFSQAQTKKMKQEAVMQRLGQWQKGMKKSQSQHEQEVADIWDDPAKRWEGAIHKPFNCAYEGYANRFNIKPGFRWDGVVRGNGFETQYLQSINMRKAQQNKEIRDYLKDI